MATRNERLAKEMMGFNNFQSKVSPLDTSLPSYRPPSGQDSNYNNNGGGGGGGGMNNKVHDEEHGGGANGEEGQKKPQSGCERASATCTVPFVLFFTAVIPQVMDAGHIVLKIFWILCYIGLVTVFGIQMNGLWTTYRAYNVSTSLSRQRASSAEFPLVTFCNNNAIRKSQIQNVRNYADLAALDDYVTSTMITSLEEDFGIELSFACADDEVVCPNTGECIPVGWLCNNNNDCEDGFDEGLVANDTGFTLDCTTHVNPLLDAAFDQYNTDDYCEDGYIRCNITSEPICAKPCDNIEECSNGFDEMEDIGCPSWRECGQDYTLTTMTPQPVTSPNHPNTYPTDRYCYWLLTAPPGETIAVTFTAMDVELIDGACDDYLKFYDGDSEDATVIPDQGNRNRICGTTMPTGIQSTGNTLFVTFDSGNSHIATGFSFNAVSSSGVVRAKRDTLSDATSPAEQLENSSHPQARRRVKKFSQSRLETEKREQKRRAYNMRKKQQYRKKRAAEELKRERRTAPDYDKALTYDESFWDNYEEWYNSYDSFGHYDTDLEEFDWISVYEQSQRPDYSDFASFASFTQSEAEWFGTQSEDFIVQCTFDGRACSHDSFTRYTNPKYGNCYLFNTVYNLTAEDDGSYNEIRSTARQGQEYGLKVTLFINEEDYIGVLTPQVGAQVLLSSSKSFPFPESEGMLLPVGFNTRIATRQTLISRQGGRYGDCVNSWPTTGVNFAEHFTISWPFYSYKACEQYCVQEHIFEDCGCVDHYLEGLNEGRNESENVMCSYWNTTIRDCVNNAYKNYRNGLMDCDSVCHPECETTEYETTSSIGEWPSPQFTPYLIQYLRRNSQSSVVQDYISSLISAENDELISSSIALSEELRHQFLRTEIYFKELNFEILAESPKYTELMLISDFGGNIGLFIGWSCLTAAEFVVLFVNLFKTGFTGQPCQ